MDNILKTIGEYIPHEWLQIIVLFLCLYYAAVGGAKLLDLLKGFTPEKRLSLYKVEIEILKLKYEIAALKKTNDLDDIAFVLDDKQPKKTAQSISEKLANRLWKIGKTGQGLVICAVLGLQLFGFLCAGVIVIAVRQYIITQQMSSAEAYVAVATLVLGATAFYLLFHSVAPVLKSRSRIAYKLTSFASAAVACLATVSMWLKQSV